MKTIIEIFDKCINKKEETIINNIIFKEYPTELLSSNFEALIVKTECPDEKTLWLKDNRDNTYWFGLHNMEESIE